MNLAVRLESAAKQYGVYIIVSKNTLKMCHNRFQTQKPDTIKFVGKTEPVVVYKLIGEKGNLDHAFKVLLPLYTKNRIIL
ncbi:hypothetical protein CHISP_1999 [Chitinispirillum alkaliphilum]|nr:hypothetical protein CHISP_1999 [Chitinispirillum alkaliphilum]